MNFKLAGWLIAAYSTISVMETEIPYEYKITDSSFHLFWRCFVFMANIYYEKYEI